MLGEMGRGYDQDKLHTFLELSEKSFLKNIWMN